MCSERDEAKEMLVEQTLALFDPALREYTPCGCQFDRTPFEFGELQDLKSRGNREQVIDFQRKVLRDLGQFGMPLEGRRGQSFDKAAELVNRNKRQRLHEPAMDLTLCADRFRHARGEDRIEFVHNGTERRIEPVARLRQRHRHLGGNVSGIRAEDDNPVAHCDRFLDIVRNQEHGLGGQLMGDPEIEEVGSQRFGCQDIER